MIACACGGVIELALLTCGVAGLTTIATSLYNWFRRRMCKCRCCPHNRSE